MITDLTASRPMTADEVETVLNVFADAANRRTLTQREQEVRRAVYAEHCQIMAAYFGRELAARQAGAVS